ncbi:P-loop containing nucleoside triphosphate hydrolase protein [Lyophyllum atratum]|nr:P-loop containing nucleoside triphosphate hydrolase protein [Lyophyllum atratum]
MGKNQSKKTRRAHAQDVAITDGGERDIVIPVMGPTGAGKSTFINALFDSAEMQVGHTLISCTSRIQFAVIKSVESPYQALKGCRVVIVDTPGFDDTYEGDAEILRRIADWLEKSYKKKAVLGGIIYLQDISHSRFTGTGRRNLEMFNHLCGDAALHKVVLGTTHWGKDSVMKDGKGEEREKELKTLHWKPMLDKGSKTRRFQDTKESAMEFINMILRNKVMDTILQIQTELAIDHKILPQTRAGKELRYTLEQILEMQKKMVRYEEDLAQGGGPEARAKVDETRKTIEGLTEDVKALTTPWMRRLLSWFGF